MRSKIAALKQNLAADPTFVDPEQGREEEAPEARSSRAVAEQHVALLATARHSVVLNVRIPEWLNNALEEHLDKEKAVRRRVGDRSSAPTKQSVVAELLVRYLAERGEL